VEELSSFISTAPMSGEALFNAHAVLKVPVELRIEALQSQLEQLADDLIVEISLATIE
jgi:glycine cleavage system regulatory protein